MMCINVYNFKVLCTIRLWTYSETLETNLCLPRSGGFAGLNSAAGRWCETSLLHCRSNMPDEPCNPSGRFPGLFLVASRALWVYGFSSCLRYWPLCAFMHTSAG